MSLHSYLWFQIGVIIRNAQIEAKSLICSPCHLEIWRMTLKINRATFLCYSKLCASFRCHLWIQTGITVRKLLTQVKSVNLFVRCDLEIWGRTLKNNRAPLLCNFKLCASFCSHLCEEFQLELWFGNIQIGAKIVLSSVTLTFDFWSWIVAWTLSYIG